MKTRGMVKSRPNDVVQTDIPGCSGVYIRGSVQGVPVTFTVDSGASRTVLSTRIYDLIGDEHKIRLNNRVHVPLQQAGGNPLNIHGIIELKLVFEIISNTVVN